MGTLAKALLPRDGWGYSLLLIAVLLAWLLYSLRGIWEDSVLLPVLVCGAFPVGLLFYVIVMFVQFYKHPGHPGPLLLHAVLLALALLPAPPPAREARFFWAHQAEYEQTAEQILAGRLPPDANCSRSSVTGFVLPQDYAHLTAYCAWMSGDSQRTVTFTPTGDARVLVYGEADSAPCYDTGLGDYRSFRQLNAHWFLCQYEVWSH